MMKIEVTVRDLKKVIISFIIATLIFMNVVIVANEPKNNEVKKIKAKSSEVVELIRLNDRNFYKTLSMKFSDLSK